MKKTLAVAMSIAVVAGAFLAPAEAGKRKKRITRTVEGSYDLPPLVIAGTCSQSGAIGCVQIVTGPKETYLRAQVTDQHGQPVAVSVSENTDGNTGDDVTYGEFCGKTDKPIKLPPGGHDLHLWVGAATDVAVSGCAPGAATSGTVKVTLSNMP